MLKRKSLLAVLVLVIVLAIVGGVSWVLINSNPPPELSIEEQARNAAMAYINTNHPETAQYMQNLVWTGGRTTPSMIVGAETYSYQSQGWNVTMQYPVVPNPIYTITADYASPTSQVTPAQKIVAWLGTWQNGTITETSYNNTQLPIQEQVRNNVMAYLKTNHPETAQFMNNLAWTGGRVTPSDILGAETYTYTSQGWNVTIQYPVVPNPIYDITADYSAVSTMGGASIPYRVIWQGTWENGSITETSYTFAE